MRQWHHIPHTIQAHASPSHNEASKYPDVDSYVPGKDPWHKASRVSDADVPAVRAPFGITLEALKPAFHPLVIWILWWWGDSRTRIHTRTWHFRP